MTKEFEIYEHGKGGAHCNENGFSFRKEGPVYDECFMCGNELEYVETEEVDASLPEVEERTKNVIHDLEPKERAIFFGMTMESLRGNWTTVRERCAIIGEICDVGCGNILSDDFLSAAKSKARTQVVFARAQYQYNDGRIFRGDSNGCYGKLWEQVEKDPEKMRILSTYIPNDMTFDDWKLKKIEEEVEAEN